MCRDALAAHPRLLNRDLDLGVGHRREFGRNACDVLAGEVELHRVDAVFEEPAHDAAHLFGAVDDGAEAEFGIGQMRQGLVGKTAGHGNLLTGREITRTRDLPGCDGVTDDDVEPGLRRRGADAGGPAALEIALGDVGAPQDVLLGRHALDGAKARLVIPREMRVCLGHPRHQRRAGGVDYRYAGGLEGTDPAGDASDAVTVDQHLAAIGCSAAPVENPSVGEEHAGHGSPPGTAVCGARDTRFRRGGPRLIERSIWPG